MKKIEIIYQNKLLYKDFIWNKPLQKFSRGRLLVISGSRGKIDIPVQIIESAFKAGSGLVTFGYPRSLEKTYKGLIPEEISLPLPETLSGSLSVDSFSIINDFSREANLLFVGPGISQNAETMHLVWNILSKITCNTFVAGSGISALTIGINILKKANKPFNQLFEQKTVITYLNLGELKNLLDSIGSKQEITENDGSAIREGLFNLSNELGIYIVYNGKEEILIAGDNKLLVTPGHFNNSFKLVLMGIIASFLSQNSKNTLESIATAILLFKYAAELAVEKNPKATKIDIIKNIPNGMLKLEKEADFL